MSRDFQKHLIKPNLAPQLQDLPSCSDFNGRPGYRNPYMWNNLEPNVCYDSFSLESHVIQQDSYKFVWSLWLL